MTESTPSLSSESTGVPPRGPLPFLVGWVDRIRAMDQFELGLTMTLAMIAISLHEPFWYLKLGIMTLAVSAIVIRPLQWSPWVWFGLVAVYVLSIRFTWFEQNNHDFLRTYWCLGVGFSLLAAAPRQALAWNARILIGLCFLFATVWKLISIDYLNGEFFHYFLLQDSRFELISRFLGGLTPEQLRPERLVRVDYTSYGDPTAGIAVRYAADVGWISPILTWWTVFIEAAVAGAFLSPVGTWLSKWRDVVLVLFMLSTYIIAPVLFFAWILCGMGVIQCESERLRFAPALYTLVFVLILVRFYVPV